MAIFNHEIKISCGQIILTKIPTQRLGLRVYFTISKLKSLFLMSPVRENRPVVGVVFSHFLSFALHCCTDRPEQLQCNFIQMCSHSPASPPSLTSWFTGLSQKPRFAISFRCYHLFWLFAQSFTRLRSKQHRSGYAILRSASQSLLCC